MIKFNKFYNQFNILSILLIITSLLFLIIKGLNFGIDFKGGTLIELRSNDKKINVSSLRDNLSQMNLGDISVKRFGNDIDYLIKFENKDNIKNVVEEIRLNLDKSFGNNFNFRRVENVGPKVSSELLRSGIIAISISLAVMLIYIWIRFEWQFSLGAIIALFHDVIVTLGLFSLLNLEINLSIIAAVLTIVGYSMNDTVVIFDRVRENLRKYSDIKIFELTNISINETLSRTLITSITTLLALLSIFFLGGEILRGFSLAMIFGVIFGTYSSIYIANTVLVRLNVSQKTILKEEQSKIN
jgi:preprotein translocase subunit SecF